MKITDVLGCMSWAAFFLLASAWIPLVGPFFSLLTPLPFLFYSSKLGLYQGVKLAAVVIFSIALLAKLAGYPQIIVIGLELCALGLALSEFFRRKLGVGQTIFFATLFMLLLGLCSLFFLGLSKNMGPLEVLLEYLQGHMKAIINAYKETGMSQENLIEIETYGKFITDTAYPCLMVIGTGFITWLNVIIARPFFRMGNLKYPDFVPLDQWKTPDSLIWWVIASGFAFFLLSGIIKLAAANVLIVVMVIYLFHGLSIVLFFLNKYHLPPWIKIGICFLIMIQFVFLVMLALAGIFDQWIDFRKIHKRLVSQ